MGVTRVPHRNFQRAEDLTDVVKKSPILWVVTLYSPLIVNLRFGGTHHLYLQSRWIIQTKASMNQVKSRAMKILSSGLYSSEFYHFILDPDDRGDMFIRNFGWFSANYMTIHPRKQVSPEGLNDLIERNYNVNSISLWLTSSSNNPSRHIVTKYFILSMSPEDVSLVSPENRMDNKWRMQSNKTSCSRGCV